MKADLDRFLSLSNTIIVGKEEKLRLALCCLFAGGHLLIEDIPGVGKTTMAKLLSKLLGLKLNRVQFTNDLLPSDILGFQIFDTAKNDLRFHKGPIFGQVILADELNRASPKTQSALLQVMEENRVTIDGQTFDTPSPFFVIATQNPREQIGTNPLPQSQIDRFLMKISMGHPDKQAEKQLLLGKNRWTMIEEVKSLFTPKVVEEIQAEVLEVKVSEAIADYIVEILAASRVSTSAYESLSPRAGLDLFKASQSWAYLQGRNHCLPEDVQAVAGSVLGHRLIAPLQSNLADEKGLANQLISQVPVY